MRRNQVKSTTLGLPPFLLGLPSRGIVWQAVRGGLREGRWEAWGIVLVYLAVFALFAVEMFLLKSV